VRETLGIPRRRWKNSFKMALQQVRWKGMDWIDVAKDIDRWRAVVNAVICLLVP
jgi:hypothetical protein